jgi:predicted TPR repeat methyltransferase
MTTDPKEFWEKKILGWEHGRYELPSKGSTLIERLANQSSDSLRFRLNVTCKLLRRHVENKKVVEIGCGSGLLAEPLLALGARSYTGYDIAENAVAEAKGRAKLNGLSNKAAFHVKRVSELPSLDADIIFSLGLVDWLTNIELDALFRAGGRADYLHAIAESRLSISQMLHRIYVHLAYGHRTGSYVPRYYKVAELEKMIQQYKQAQVHVFRHPKLSFGALISSLPLDET